MGLSRISNMKQVRTFLKEMRQLKKDYGYQATEDMLPFSRNRFTASLAPDGKSVEIKNRAYIPQHVGAEQTDFYQASLDLRKPKYLNSEIVSERGTISFIERVKGFLGIGRRKGFANIKGKGEFGDKYSVIGHSEKDAIALKYYLNGEVYGGDSELKEAIYLAKEIINAPSPYKVNYKSKI